MTAFETLISAEELNTTLGEDDLVILDGTWFLPNVDRDAQAEFRQQHIPGAVFFDIDATSDQHSSLPHMVPGVAEFESAVEKLGVSNHSRIVVYDALGLFSAARVWWLFKLFGHDQVAVLDGGLPAWQAAGHAVTDDKPVVSQGDFRAALNPDMAVSLQSMQTCVQQGQAVILDARSAGRYTGEAPEPRPELQSGHMPGAQSLPATELLVDGKLKSRGALLEMFSRLAVSEDTPVVTTCGSGVTAAIIALAMVHCGLGIKQLYDGSWTEWASLPENPIERET